MPDKQHAQYFKQNPDGNHSKPSDETLRFMDKTSTRYNYLQETILGIKDTLIEFKAITTEGIKEMHRKQDHTNGWIQDHDKTWQEYEPMLRQIKQNKEDNKTRVKDLFWRVAIGIVVVLAGFGGLEKLAELL